jgi:hypothetical protein
MSNFSIMIASSISGAVVEANVESLAKSDRHEHESCGIGYLDSSGHIDPAFLCFLGDDRADARNRPPPRDRVVREHCAFLVDRVASRIEDVKKIGLHAFLGHKVHQLLLCRLVPRGQQAEAAGGEDRDIC